MSSGRSDGRNSMLIIAGHLIVEAADRDRYIADCAMAVTQARRAPGCLDFALTADPLDPARVNVYERWQSDAELATFRGSGPDAETAPRIRVCCSCGGEVAGRGPAPARRRRAVRRSRRRMNPASTTACLVSRVAKSGSSSTARRSGRSGNSMS